ncbi:4-(cytidine 5'-diphospho)-2-C-methyl-D-erythritol kinase [Sphingomonas sp.]|uniref:4-(cytidine 5'-diphospho)-2-C-methyl-D-erythritol kinase n=1 Tax=Sphingomonas sp. TaxID=28214 RepID=UPI00286B126F|nr:4-(cytidine 5'-diphospho)-2-C-methyl-D-erythritol kinase [Sphingomonas sp.]
MSRLTETAYAKLNLALHVRGKRADGYHAIETIFAFCEDGDALSAEGADSLSLDVSGPFAADIPDDDANLAIEAARLFRLATDVSAGARLQLIKILPVASGIGGGSADAAAVLRLLTRMWTIPASVAVEVAPLLGADVPACLLSQSCRGDGTGDQVGPIELGLGGTPVLLINHGAPLSTKAVFERWDGMDRGPLDDWREGRNDLEVAAISLVPEIADVLHWLRGQAGAEVVHMSGSGATCFALFADEAARDLAATHVPPPWWHLATRLR